MKDRLYRSSDDSIIGGVCGGLGEYFDVDPVIIRLIWGVSILCYGVGLLPYILCWVIIPEK